MKQDTPEALSQPQSDAGPEEPGKGIAGSLGAGSGRGLAETPSKVGSSSAPAGLQFLPIPTEKVTEGFRMGGTLTPRPLISPSFSLQEPGPSSSSAPISGASR